MENKSFVMYLEWIPALELLKDSEFRNLILALFDYVSAGEHHRKLSLTAEVCFSFMRKRIDFDQEKWLETKKETSGCRKEGRPSKKNTGNRKIISRLSNQKSKISKWFFCFLRKPVYVYVSVYVYVYVYVYEYEYEDDIYYIVY